jgi:threonylcarbamoyladenosine tRNA methylthiotransferase MtaB
MARALEAAGCTTIDRPAPADAYLINTCSVTHAADRKARHLIRMAKRLAPGAPVIVTGCYADWAQERIEQETGADVVLNNRAKEGAPAALLEALQRAQSTGRGDAPPVPPTTPGGRTRAFLKIQEGCDDVCAFCIVPQVRGRERARSIEAIVAEAREREAQGALEIVLTGTQPGAYGRDRDDGTNAAGLLQALLSETTLPHIRYSSIQPQDVSGEFLEQWQDGRLCRHFHLALQSGSDAVLGRMRRRYDREGFLRALETIRAAVPGAAITSDVIAGFPGETAYDFRQTVALCREAQFADIHVFPYSARPRTSAAQLPDDVPPPIKRERVRALQSLADAGAEAARAAAIGRRFAVLFERRRGDGPEAFWSGLTDTYLPVQISCATVDVDLRNRLVPISIDHQSGGALAGRVLE